DYYCAARDNSLSSVLF
nr:immunoglobulin light chain junction region [Macaca mulatta]